MNTQNYLEEVGEYVRQQMDANGTIPDEAFKDLVIEEYNRRLQISDAITSEIL